MSIRLIANWKLNGSKDFSNKWISHFIKNFSGNNFASIGIAPPSPYIDYIRQINHKYDLAIGAQNIDSENLGARTGEISAMMLKDIGCKFCIIGHSERRILFNESNKDICQKLSRANEHSVLPVLCIGESEEENAKNLTFDILEDQIVQALEYSSEITSLIIAYEPVWAIGSGQTPDPLEINSIHQMIKDVVQSRFPKTDLKNVLYGGSVNLNNASTLFEQQYVDGALIGGASLDGKEFANIANVFNEFKL
tara:strand:+ start:219 stop:971 length:753 start_codon:yes stop_codon:yes gene_type:complete